MKKYFLALSLLIYPGCTSLYAEEVLSSTPTVEKAIKPRTDLPPAPPVSPPATAQPVAPPQSPYGSFGVQFRCKIHGIIAPGDIEPVTDNKGERILLCRKCLSDVLIKYVTHVKAEMVQGK